MYYQIHRMKTIDGHNQKIKSQYGDCVQECSDQFCQLLKKGSAMTFFTFVSRKEQFINNISVELCHCRDLRDMQTSK